MVRDASATGGGPVALISRGFRGRRRADVDPARIPPGQYVVEGFPVLSAGPTPRVSREAWSFSIKGAAPSERTWSWEEFARLHAEPVHTDIHCVTKWTKLDTTWTGVSVDVLLDGIATSAGFVSAYCDGGYTTNLPLADVTGGKAWIAYEFDGQPLEPKHGGPARLLVPHLYFWKSAKWVRGLQLLDHDEPGFWEGLGYHNRGDPWKEERYWSD
jgi:DMSO/TMAO reductase YedYZ molybdopterin-dependent catalytic subunit